MIKAYFWGFVFKFYEILRNNIKRLVADVLGSRGLSLILKLYICALGMGFYLPKGRLKQNSKMNDIGHLFLGPPTIWR